MSIQVRLAAGLSLAAIALAGCASPPVFTEVRTYEGPVLAPEYTPSMVAEDSGPMPPGGPVQAFPSIPVPVLPVPEVDFAGPWVVVGRWCEANRLSAPKLVRPQPSPAYAFGSANGTFILNPGSDSAFWNGLEVRLAYAPQVQNGEPVMHALDLKRTVQPLLFAAPLGLGNSSPVIVLDPGHGGEDSGARRVVGAGLEKDFTLDWARRLAALLLTNGWQVVLTRTTDQNVALSNRVSAAEAANASMFLSLHFNSSGSDSGHTGVETYCLTPSGLPSNVTRSYPDDLSLVFPNNQFDVQNLQLAVRVHRSVLRVSGARDRGVRRARFLTVLRGQQRPAILIEGGYLSNPREAALIATPTYRQKLAEAVASALLLPPQLASGSALAHAGAGQTAPGAPAQPGLEPGLPLSPGPAVNEQLVP